MADHDTERENEEDVFAAFEDFLKKRRFEVSLCNTAELGKNNHLLEKLEKGLKHDSEEKARNDAESKTPGKK